MKSCSHIFLVSMLYSLPLFGAQPLSPQKPKGKTWDTPVTTQQPTPTKIMIDGQTEGINPREYEKIQNGSEAYNFVLTRVIATYNKHAERFHMHPMRTPKVPFNRLSLEKLRNQQEYYFRKITELQNQLALQRNAQEEATVLGLKHALTHISQAPYIEATPENPTFNLESGLAFFKDNLLGDVPPLLKETIQKQVILEFGKKITLKKTELTAFVETLQLPKKLYLDAYTPEIKSLSLHTAKDTTTKTPSLLDVFEYQNGPNADQIKDLVTHKKRSFAVFKTITHSQTNPESVTTHGACFLKDDKTGDIVVMPETTGKPGSESFNADHSKARGILMNEEAEKLVGVASIKNKSAADKEVVKVRIEATIEQLKKFEENRYNNQEKIDELTSQLALDSITYASLIAISERTAIDREIQAAAHAQMSSNAGMTDSKKGWGRALFDIVKSKTDQTPQEVFFDAVKNQAQLSYERKLAAYSAITPVVQEHAKKLSEGAKAVTDYRTARVKIKAKNNFLKARKQEPYELTHRKYASLLEVWSLQKPTFEKEIERLLPQVVFKAWKKEKQEAAAKKVPTPTAEAAAKKA